MRNRLEAGSTFFPLGEMIVVTAVVTAVVTLITVFLVVPCLLAMLGERRRFWLRFLLLGLIALPSAISIVIAGVGRGPCLRSP